MNNILNWMVNNLSAPVAPWIPALTVTGKES